MSFPKGLSFAFDRMAGFSKQMDIVRPDRDTNVGPDSTIRVKFNPNSLINQRTICMYYTFTTSAVGTTQTTNYIQGRFHPRLSSSIIENIGVYMNSYLIDQVNDYNLYYKALYDLSASSAEQDSKRWLEGADPSVAFRNTGFAGTGYTSAVGNTIWSRNLVNLTDVGRTFVINNWANFWGTSSTEFIDTSDTGDFEAVIKLAPLTIMFQTVLEGTLAAAATTATYTLNNIYFTYERVMLEDPLYFEIKRSKLMSAEGLEIQWNSVSTHVSSATTGNRNINFSFSTSAQSLDSIICTTRRSTYNTAISSLELEGAGTANTNQNFRSIVNGATQSVIAFNDSTYFRRDLAGLVNSQITINGTQMYKQPLGPEQIYNEAIIALNNQGDLTQGVHAGCCNLVSFMSYYFTQILSLNYNGHTDRNLISGLDGKGSSFNINWTVNTDATVTSTVIPVVYCKKSSVVRINAGRQISIMV